MTIGPNEEIREAVTRVCSQFDMNYWAQCEQEERELSGKLGDDGMR